MCTADNGRVPLQQARKHEVKGFVPFHAWFWDTRFPTAYPHHEQKSVLGWGWGGVRFLVGQKAIVRGPQLLIVSMLCVAPSMPTGDVWRAQG